MDYNEYRRAAERLYHDYQNLYLKPDSLKSARVLSLPTDTPKLPGTWRPNYEKFELFVNLLDAPEEITRQVEEFRQRILVKRANSIKTLETSFPHIAVVSNPPVRKGGKRKDYDEVIRQAEKALQVYLDSGPRLSTYLSVFDQVDTRDEKVAKNAERKVRQYVAHAKMLKEALLNGTFFEALATPLPKK